MTQHRKKRRAVSPSKQVRRIKITSDEVPAKKIVKRVPMVKKMEIAGSLNVTDLIFLAARQHIELEKQILRRVPDLMVCTTDVYYFE
jgi:hypothetical protein